MAEERYKAERLDFVQRWIVTSSSGEKRSYPLSVIAIYSASLGVMVNTNPDTDILFEHHPYDCWVFIDDEAERRYAALKSKLSRQRIKPTEIEVGREFSDWGRALCRAQRPDRSLVDLLDLTR